MGCRNRNPPREGKAVRELAKGRVRGCGPYPLAQPAGVAFAHPAASRPPSPLARRTLSCVRSAYRLFQRTNSLDFAATRPGPPLRAVYVLDQRCGVEEGPGRDGAHDIGELEL